MSLSKVFDAVRLAGGLLVLAAVAGIAFVLVMYEILHRLGVYVVYQF